jgi:hypothetical protein
MKELSGFRIAASLAITVVVAYALCALLFAFFPNASLGFMNALFHGLDFGALQASGRGFDVGGFAVAGAVMAAWAFLVGLLFAWVLRFNTPRWAGRPRG